MYSSISCFVDIYFCVMCIMSCLKIFLPVQCVSISCFKNISAVQCVVHFSLRNLLLFDMQYIQLRGYFTRAGHSLIFSRFAIRSPLNFFPWIADAHTLIFWISLFARRSNARRSTRGSLSEKGLNHSSLSINLSYIYTFFAKREFSRGFLYISLISA